MKKSRKRKVKPRRFTRREALGGISAGLAGAAFLSHTFARPARGEKLQNHNILFIFTDQERHFSRWPKGLSLPGHERLSRTGVYLQNHCIGATMCTSSRSIMLTGLQTPDNRMFENCDVPWVKDLSPEIPTIGHMLQKAGYYTAYKGKWHLTRSFDQEFPPEHLFTKEMEAYGFADYVSPGDIVGHTLGGYTFDHIIAGSAISWLRRVGGPLNDDGKPWSLTVSLVNPHDIMYFNTDAPGKKVQDSGHLLKVAAPAPNNKDYASDWDMPVPANFTQTFDAPGRPSAHGEFLKAWDYILGRIPPEEERWRRFNNFYVNSIRAVDSQITNILKELDALGLTDNTIIVFTADHGEMAGAHGLRGKGPFAYQETLHVPLYIVHPDVRGGQTCRALTSHIDLAPSLLAMAGVSRGNIPELAGRELPGKDLTSMLGRPGGAPLNAVREGALFTYSGLSSNDSELVRLISEAAAAGKDPMTEIAGSGFKPDLRKRGTLRTIFDGRYKFSRYFSPLEHHKPANLDELYAHNDVEFYDLKTDPAEMNNLAADKTANADLVLATSSKLETLIEEEIGIDNGRELPDFEGVAWTFQKDRFD